MNLLKVSLNRASFILPYGKRTQCHTSENLKPSLGAPCDISVRGAAQSYKDEYAAHNNTNIGCRSR